MKQIPYLADRNKRFCVCTKGGVRCNNLALGYGDRCMLCRTGGCGCTCGPCQGIKPVKAKS